MAEVDCCFLVNDFTGPYCCTFVSSVLQLFDIVLLSDTINRSLVYWLIVDAFCCRTMSLRVGGMSIIANFCLSQTKRKKKEKVILSSYNSFAPILLIVCFRYF